MAVSTEVILPEGVCKSEREEEILQRSVLALIEILNPEEIILFGSRAGDNYSPRSDFDFAVSGSEPDFKTRQKISSTLDELRGLYSVDIVYLEDVEEDFRNVIYETGVSLYER